MLETLTHPGFWGLLSGSQFPCLLNSKIEFSFFPKRTAVCNKQPSTTVGRSWKPAALLPPPNKIQCAALPVIVAISVTSEQEESVSPRGCSPVWSKQWTNGLCGDLTASSRCQDSQRRLIIPFYALGIDFLLCQDNLNEERIIFPTNVIGATQ